MEPGGRRAACPAVLMGHTVCYGGSGTGEASHQAEDRNSASHPALGPAHLGPFSVNPLTASALGQHRPAKRTVSPHGTVSTLVSKSIKRNRGHPPGAKFTSPIRVCLLRGKTLGFLGAPDAFRGARPSGVPAPLAPPVFLGVSDLPCVLCGIKPGVWRGCCATLRVSV